ncbi:MAG: VWA domain-containing protein [Thermoanaerobaculia bacterium]
MMGRWSLGSYAATLSCILFLVSLGAVGVEGQPVKESADVSLVEVPLTVTDRAGKPIRGIPTSAFHVSDDGRPTKVDSLDAVDFGSAGVPAPASASGDGDGGRLLPAARRRFLLLFDLSFSTPSQLLRIREAARALVQKELAPDDLVAVAVFSVKKGLRLLLTFTPDRSQVAAAIQTLGYSNEKEMSSDPLQLNLSDPFTGDAPISLGKETDEIIGMYLRDEASYRQGRVDSLIQSLGDLARALASVQGRKQIVYFSQGFDSKLLQGNATDSAATASQNLSASRGEVWRIDSQQRYGSSALQASLNDTLELFKRSDCVIHAVDLLGLQNWKDPRDASGGEGNGTLFAMTRETGGVLFENGNNFPEQLGRLLETQKVVYVLTVAARVTGKPGKWHVLKVKVDRPGVVSARAGYYEPKPFSSTTALERKLIAADLIASDASRSQLPFHALVVPQPGTPLPELPVLIRVEGSALRTPSIEKKLPLEFYGYAIDRAGVVADFFAESLSLDLTKVARDLEKGGVLFYADLQVPPGEYELRLLVRNLSDGSVGSVAIPVSVPAFSSGSPRVEPPLVVGNPPSGIVIHAVSARLRKSTVQRAFPFQLGTEPFLPEVSPSLRAGESARIYVVTYAFGSENLKLSGQILEKGGRPLKTAELSILGRTPPDSFGRATYLLAFKTDLLKPGTYGLRILAQSEGSGVSRQASSRFEIR